LDSGDRRRKESWCRQPADSRKKGDRRMATRQVALLIVGLVAGVLPCLAYGAQVTLFEETFSSDPFAGGRWRVEKDGEARPGTVAYQSSGGQCGSPAGYIERVPSGHRDVIYNSSFGTTGYVNLKLTFWYRNESGASVIAYVLRDGVWTAAANAGAAAAWTKSETSLTGTITGIFFRLDSGDNKYRRLDCISIVGEPDCTPPVVITQHPTNLSVCPGSPVAFSVSATGSNLTYQWRKNGVDLADGGNVSGATTDTLLIADAQLADNGRYRCVVTGDCGTVLSNLADLTVSEQPTVTQQPQSRNVLAGSAATFTVAASGAGTLSYQWQKDGADLNDGGNVSGAHAAQLQISNVGEDDQANYRCAVTDDCGTVISKPALLTMRYEVVLFEETFSTDPFSGGRWRIEKDGVARPGTVNYYTSGGQCGSPAGYIERHYDGHRDVIYNGSFTTAGHGNLKLIFWYHNDSSAAITSPRLLASGNDSQSMSARPSSVGTKMGFSAIAPKVLLPTPWTP